MARLAQFESIYTAFENFLQRCLVEDQSLLWPDHEIWTITNLEQARRRFVESFIQGKMFFRQKLESQLGGAPGEVWALIADCFYVYGLPSHTLRFTTKRSWVEWAAKPSGLALPGEQDAAWIPLRDGFAPTGQKYNLKHAQLRLLVLMALEVKAAENRAAVVRSPEALQNILDSILESIPIKLDRANDMRNAILHMAFPDLYEPILSNQDKEAILQHYSGQVADLPADRDAALRQVRETIAPRFIDLGRPFDFFLDAREEWRETDGAVARAISDAVRSEAMKQAEPAQRNDSASPVQGDGGQQVRERAEVWPAAVDPDVRRVLAALRLTHNLILSGPPGTGKTYIAQKAARALVEGQGVFPESYVWWVTMHAAYAYEDFVEGLRPVLGTRGENAVYNAPGQIGYEIRPGIFREVVERAAHDPENTYVLVIDEINRGNLARVLGELITLIEDDKRGVLSTRLIYSGARFSVPPNLIILGTMNTADRSIALLDTALRRRFAFVEISPRPELVEGVTIETDEAAVRLDNLLRCLNAAVSEHLGVDHQIGHSYFMRIASAAPEERLAMLALVWNTQILPLLEEYFYSRKDRLTEILASFIDDGDGSPAREIARLTGEDLVVALSRVCD